MPGTSECVLLEGAGHDLNGGTIWVVVDGFQHGLPYSRLEVGAGVPVLPACAGIAIEPPDGVARSVGRCGASSVELLEDPAGFGYGGLQMVDVFLHSVAGIS
ncbi:MAG: hypothetical protein GDA41_09705 [Rhodospirillales bacterium]|nr:hypothetical protein [Rhodospirillales bacterium]